MHIHARPAAITAQPRPVDTDTLRCTQTSELPPREIYLGGDHNFCFTLNCHAKLSNAENSDLLSSDLSDSKVSCWCAGDEILTVNGLAVQVKHCSRAVSKQLTLNCAGAVPQRGDLPVQDDQGGPGDPAGGLAVLRCTALTELRCIAGGEAGGWVNTEPPAQHPQPRLHRGRHPGRQPAGPQL